MRFIRLLCLVFAVFALGAVERTAYASGVSGPDAIAASPALPIAHAGHVATHKVLPGGDMSSMMCKILCALAVSQLPLAVPNGFDSQLQVDTTIAVAGNVQVDEAASGLDLPPPR